MQKRRIKATFPSFLSLERIVETRLTHFCVQIALFHVVFIVPRLQTASCAQAGVFILTFSQWPRATAERLMYFSLAVFPHQMLVLMFFMIPSLSDIEPV